MQQLRVIVTGMFILLPVIIFAQAATTSSKLVGKWLLVKHTLTENKKTEDLLTSNETYTYEFKNNGTYDVSYTSKKTESTTIYKGKWQIINNGKKLKLYNNHLAGDNTTLVGDKLLPVVRLTAIEFVTKELLFGMDLLGTSYYKKR